MSRVSTFGNYQSALLDLMTAESRAMNAQERVSTQKNATSLVGFGRQTETLTALKGASSRIDGFLSTSEAVTARLKTQDLALNQINDGVSGLREAIGNSIASDSAGSLMLEMEGYFQSIRGGLTMRHEGSYLFSGAAIDRLPLNIGNLSELAAAASVDDVFQNDSLKTVSRVAEGTTLQTGFLADEVGKPVFEILRAIQQYDDGPNGPLEGKLNAVQKQFLTEQMSLLEQAGKGVIDKTATTGSMANQVENLTKSHKAQIGSLDELVADRTDADMAKAVTDLQLSQIAIQASAQVISQLRDTSLLNFLR